MKKRLFVVMLSVMVLITGCSNKRDVNLDISTGKKGTEDVTTEDEISTKAASKATTLTITEFDELLARQPIYVTETEYLDYTGEYKNLYPDALFTGFRNNTDADIKDVIIGIAAWDKKNRPVKIEAHMNYSGGEYFTEVNYNDINLEAGGTFRLRAGLTLSKECHVDKFKSVIVSFTTFDGDTWENPYVDSFRKAYENNKYSDDIVVEVEEKDTQFVKSETSPDSMVDSALADELSAALEEQPLYVKETEYVITHKEYKDLYPDMLRTILKNNSESDIKEAVIAFVAWDENGLPVKIIGQLAFEEPAYVTMNTLEDINMIPGSTFGESDGYKLKVYPEFRRFKAMVASYTTSEGEKWENPLFQDFCDLYEGKRIILNYNKY